MWQRIPSLFFHDGGCSEKRSRLLPGQDRVTVTLNGAGRKTIHIRSAAGAEPRQQQAIFDARRLSVDLQTKRRPFGRLPLR